MTLALIHQSEGLTRCVPLAMPVGSLNKDVINLDVDSLWSGGPFGATVLNLLSAYFHLRSQISSES
jgi:hypothetical protein